jgi:hypothetical protein
LFIVFGFISLSLLQESTWLTWVKVDLIVPAEAYDAVQEAIARRPAPEFRRVVMSLREVLGGEFFTEYVKKGMKNPQLLESVFSAPDTRQETS